MDQVWNLKLPQVWKVLKENDSLKYQPVEYFKPGNISLGSTSRTDPFVSANSLCITDSFSIGFIEHVEYTILPPVFKSSTPLLRILYWILKNKYSDHVIMIMDHHNYPWRFRALAGVHFSQISGFFLNVPSPEQGTSHSILSKYTWK